MHLAPVHLTVKVSKYGRKNGSGIRYLFVYLPMSSLRFSIGFCPDEGSGCTAGGPSGGASVVCCVQRALSVRGTAAAACLGGAGHRASEARQQPAKSKHIPRHIAGQLGYVVS